MSRKPPGEGCLLNYVHLALGDSQHKNDKQESGPFVNDQVDGMASTPITVGLLESIGASSGLASSLVPRQVEEISIGRDELPPINNSETLGFKVSNY